jgi:polysaccharide pyruvyl transferase WcaK-like protein
MNKIAKLKQQIIYKYENDYNLIDENVLIDYYYSQDMRYLKKHYKHCKQLLSKSELTQDENLQEILKLFVYDDYIRRYK